MLCSAVSSGAIVDCCVLLQFSGLGRSLGISCCLCCRGLVIPVLLCGFYYGVCCFGCLVGWLLFVLFFDIILGACFALLGWGACDLVWIASNCADFGWPVR